MLGSVLWRGASGGLRRIGVAASTGMPSRQDMFATVVISRQRRLSTVVQFNMSPLLLLRELVLSTNASSIQRRRDNALYSSSFWWCTERSSASERQCCLVRCSSRRTPIFSLRSENLSAIIQARCRSWHLLLQQLFLSTRYAPRRLTPHTVPGTWYLIQQYRLPVYELTPGKHMEKSYCSIYHSSAPGQNYVPRI